MLEVGIKAPDFKLPDQNGDLHSLSDYLGKKVILYFYPRDNTAGCTKQACGFSERYPSIPVYRSHVSPYFKVTVGDFRTRDDAQRFASKLTNSGLYRYVFVVKEQINYPGF